MPFNVKNFVTSSSGFIKPGKFQMQVQIPPGFSGQSDGSFMQTVGGAYVFSCTEASLPGVDMMTSPILAFGYGSFEKRPMGGPLFGDVQVMINCDAKGMQWTFFRKWLSLVTNFYTFNGIGTTGRQVAASGVGTTQAGTLDVYEASFKDDICTDISITSYDDAGNTILVVNLNEAYPISLSNMKLDWGVDSQIAKFSVTFTARDWYQSYKTAQGTVNANDGDNSSL